MLGIYKDNTFESSYNKHDIIFMLQREAGGRARQTVIPGQSCSRFHSNGQVPCSELGKGLGKDGSFSPNMSQLSRELVPIICQLQ